MAPPPVSALDPAVRDYAWGSRRFLAELQGRPTPAERPEAEAWFGAHPGAPARVTGPGGAMGLDELVATDPRGTLGDRVLERFGPRLPFLVKLLAAEAPLSLQAHPSAQQARRGFEIEEALGIPRDAPHRSYRDAWPKPEVLLALTPFRALCGFRAPEETAAFLAALDVPGLRPLAQRLAADGEAALAPAMAWALRDGRDAAIASLPSLRTAAVELRDRPDGATGPPAEDPPSWWAAAAGVVVDLVDRYPGDPGAMVALLLRLVALEPGEAVHLPDGNLHAYLGGAGVEVMASSDNVLRGGLTAKHVDVDALLEVVDARQSPPPYVTAETHGAETVLVTPTPQFRLSSVRLGGGAHRLRSGGPQILVAIGGSVTVRADGHEVTVRRGYGAFIAARAREVAVAGEGQLIRTTVGEWA